MGFGIEQRIGELRVIGEEEKALARLVEPTDRGEVGVVVAFQAIEDGRAAFGVMAGGD
ncbi:hypothetical protein D3C80_367250 [compost metagenome]